MASKKRSKRLSMVVDLARRKREEADRVLQESRQRLEAAQRGLTQLEIYLDEYLEASRLSEGQISAVSQLQTQAAFIQRLRGSIRQQVDVVKQSEQQHAQVEQWWRAQYAREKAVSKLQKKAFDSEQQLEEKQTQKQIDELSQRRQPNFI